MFTKKSIFISVFIILIMLILIFYLKSLRFQISFDKVKGIQVYRGIPISKRRGIQVSDGRNNPNRDPDWGDQYADNRSPCVRYDINEDGVCNTADLDIIKLYIGKCGIDLKTAKLSEISDIDGELCLTENDINLIKGVFEEKVIK